MRIINSGTRARKEKNQRTGKGVDSEFGAVLEPLGPWGFGGKEGNWRAIDLPLQANDWSEREKVNRRLKRCEMHGLNKIPAMPRLVYGFRAGIPVSSHACLTPHAGNFLHLASYCAPRLYIKKGVDCLLYIHAILHLIPHIPLVYLGLGRIGIHKSLMFKAQALGPEVSDSQHTGGPPWPRNGPVGSDQLARGCRVSRYADDSPPFLHDFITFLFLLLANQTFNAPAYGFVLPR